MSERQILLRRIASGAFEVVVLAWVPVFVWIYLLGGFAMAGWPPIWVAGLLSITLYCVMIGYIFLRDWLFGKGGVFRALFGLWVVDRKSGRGVSLAQSLARNSVFGVPAIFALWPLLHYVPVVSSWDTWGMVGFFGLVGVEGLALVISHGRYRLGDFLAKTEVRQMEGSITHKRARLAVVYLLLILVAGFAGSIVTVVFFYLVGPW